MGDSLRELIDACASLARQGLTRGSGGNASVVVDDTLLISGSGTNLGELTPASFAAVSLAGEHLEGPKPSKEVPLHLACVRRGGRAVIHLHSPSAVAASCLPAYSERSALPPVTPYLVMRVGQTPLLPYAEPGSVEQAAQLEGLPFDFRAALLQNHGPITFGQTVEAAAGAAVEVEEAAALHLLTFDKHPRILTGDEVRALTARYGTTWDVEGG